MAHDSFHYAFPNDINMAIVNDPTELFIIQMSKEST